jgi:hypothetical protein
MPSDGLFIAGPALRVSGAVAQSEAAAAVAGRRLSQPTTASTRGSLGPTNDTPDAPNDCPTIPMRSGSTASQNGLNAALRPSLTRRSCFGAWLVPVVHDGRGTKGEPGVERKKSRPSSVWS